MNAKRRTSRRRRGVALAISALSALLLPLTAMPAAALTDPTPDTTVIRVNIADVRVSAGLTPSDIDSRYTEGQTLLLAADESGAEPLGDAWASCVTDADGICEFVVPDTQSGGANAGITPWIVFGDPVPGSAAALNTYVVDSFYTSNRTGQRGQIPYSVQVPAGTVTGGAIVDLPEAVDPALDTGLTQRDTFGNLGLSLNNPDLTDQCRPLQVAIVFDLSSSIGEANLPLVKEAGRALVDGLVGSGSSVALYTFSRYAPSNNTTNHALTPVDAPGGRDELVADIESYVTSSGTNWDRGIAQVAEDAPDYDIAFVLTDGLPDKSGFPYMPASSTFPQRFAEVDQGRFSANELKAEGTRVFGIGINLDDATSVPSQPESSIQAISGPNEYPEYPVTQADYAGVDWDRLVSLTSELIDEIVCRTDVTVHKTQIDREGVSSPGEGWHFDIASSNADAVIDPADGVTTDENGTATADITTTGTAATDVTITETPQPGWELADVTCTVDGEPIAVDVAEQVTLPQVSPESHAECFFTNQDIRVESTLTVHKVEAAGTGDRPGAGWSFDATATGEGVQIDPTGALVTDGEGSATAVIASPDTPFDLELTEAPQDGWTFADVSCTVDGAPVAVDSAETVSLSDVPAGSTASSSTPRIRSARR
ncbi:vWA domain-containing protein [Microbacterium sp. NPDC055903]